MVLVPGGFSFYRRTGGWDISTHDSRTYRATAETTQKQKHKQHQKQQQKQQYSRCLLLVHDEIFDVHCWLWTMSSGGGVPIHRDCWLWAVISGWWVRIFEVASVFWRLMTHSFRQTISCEDAKEIRVVHSLIDTSHVHGSGSSDPINPSNHQTWRKFSI